MSGSLILPGVGVLFIGVAVFILIRTQLFINNAQQVTGTVIRLVRSHSNKGGYSYSPVYQFRTLEGQMIEVQDNLSSNPPMFREGQTIEVLYDPSNPHKARIKKWMSLYFLPLLFGFLGSTFTCTGVFTLLMR
ncbi:MAG: Inner membrane protein YmfA [Chloroflexi bacterium OLB14]|nr:MAG: Inner membrane protein YmfA [Chloroflexi bacterium OLB14]